MAIEQVHDWMVPMGSDWTYRTMTFTVPNGIWGTSEQAYSQIVGMSVWFGCYVSDSNDIKLLEMGSIWISEPFLTITRD